jgi:DNA invertase Pin-like site-specific DNA recombinase
MIHCAVYARKSSDDTDRDVETQSCQRQIDAGVRFATEQGWTVDPRHVYRDDAVSGAEWKHRDGWNKLLADLEPTPPFSRLIVSELSRTAAIRCGPRRRSWPLKRRAWRFTAI